MKIIKLSMALGLGILVTACGTMPDVASRNAPFEVIAPLQAAPTETGMMPMSFQSARIAGVNVTVPRRLRVSEANVYYPRGDIVWRGEPIGDRHTQIQSIFEQAAFSGTHDMSGQTPVAIDLEVERFHSVSEKTRATVGGVHNMRFFMTVRDAATGLPLAPRREIEANLPAFGGNQAIEAERKGQTQKVRVTGYLAQVIRQELEAPSS